MIAILDTTRNGWEFVGKLHRMGFAVSWVVGRDVDIGFEALPMGFRGVVHRVGFEDVSQVRTAVRGCEEVMVLADETAGNNVAKMIETAMGDRDGRPYLVLRKGGAFEVSEWPTTRRDEIGREAKVVPLLVTHA